jgi:hypothetical protein
LNRERASHLLGQIRDAQLQLLHLLSLAVPSVAGVDAISVATEKR